MSIYAIVDVQVIDDSWIPQYAEKVHHMVHKHGGKYLSRSGNITTLEGEPSKASLIALIEFPAMAACQAFCSDPDYVPFGDARRSGSISNFRVIDATDIAGTIPYLAKG